MRCPNCHAESVAEAIYCRRCGTDLVEPSKSIVPVKNSLPTLLYSSPLPRRVAAGVGALALGVSIELIRRNMLTRIFPSRSVRHALPAVPGLKDVRLSRPDKALKVPKGYEIHETVVYMSRIIRREN